MKIILLAALLAGPACGFTPYGQTTTTRLRPSFYRKMSESSSEEPALAEEEQVIANDVQEPTEGEDEPKSLAKEIVETIEEVKAEFNEQVSQYANSPTVEDIEDMVEDVEKDIETEEEMKPKRDGLIQQMLQLASSTGRGEFASEQQKMEMKNLIVQLQEMNPISNPCSNPAVYGTWDLLYSDTQLFRSSPFFLAGRATCTTEEQAKQYDWFCDMHRAALAISNIQAVRQIISPTRLVSEFEVKAGAIPFLSDFTPFAYSGGWPVTIDGAIVSSADITSVENGTAFEIFMDTVEIKGSNIPGVRQALDAGLKLESRQLGQFLETTIEEYTNPKPIFSTIYLDNVVRISQDQDGKLFVYGKSSNDYEPTDYSNILSDLGVGKLLEGFNDAITKFYL